MLHDNYTKMVNVRLTEKEYELLQNYCNRYGLTITKLIRKLLQQYIIKEIKVNENK